MRLTYLLSQMACLKLFTTLVHLSKCNNDMDEKYISFTDKNNPPIIKNYSVPSDEKIQQLSIMIITYFNLPHRFHNQDFLMKSFCYQNRNHLN